MGGSLIVLGIGGMGSQTCAQMPFRDMSAGLRVHPAQLLLGGLLAQQVRAHPAVG